MGDWPFTSIVVPVFNAGDTIDKLLHSLLNLNYPRERYEIIVVDNDSQDDSPQRVRQYPVILLYELDMQSSYAARNRGARAAKGDIIAFTDADCVAHPDWLRNLLADHENHHWGGFVGSLGAYQPLTDVQRHLTNIGWFTPSFNQSSSPFVPQSKGERLCSRIKCLDYRSDIHLPPDLVNPPTANVAYRREVFDQIGFFDIYLTSGGDLDLAWRVQTQTSWQIKEVSDAVVYHQHRRSLTGMARLYRKNGWGAGLLTLKYGSDPGRVARQMGIESLILIGLSTARHFVEFIVRLFRSLLHRPTDPLYVKTPCFTVVGTLNFYFGRLTAARRGNKWLFESSSQEASCKNQATVVK